MDFLMNGLLLAATCFAGTYCWVLARRVRALKSLEGGLGGAIVTLTRQVELARTTLEEARSSSGDTKAELGKMVERADMAANQLRLLISAAPHAAPAPARVSDTAPPPEAKAAGSRGVRSEPTITARGPAAAQVRRAPRPRAVVPTMGVVADHVPRPEAEAAAGPQAVSMAIPALDRLVAGPLVRSQEPVDSGHAAARPLAEVPKPRALAPVENPLRRTRAVAAKPAPAAAEGEDALLQALSVLAGGR
ncbi:hypothetical protein HNP73_000764 [Amaricoccus macauensis]|uniref:DUF6468 domain-containing protein n=1 Tax=Amaricoccus macauensis TaxID=57001 RepID=A0A840SN48_9RHOB|nr:DUF6468 domain-containing protein [Amaricoccus macauensis]MBB5220843.1 hypothetical protein [Amaricoccus macauensis]